MSEAFALDLPRPPRALPWGTTASVALHVGLALAIVQLSPLRPLIVPAPQPVAVEIVTPAQYAALEAPPPPVLAAPDSSQSAAPAAAPATPGEERLPRSGPLTPKLKENTTITATHFYSAGILNEPGMERIRKTMGTLVDSERVVQLCNIEGLEQIKRAAPSYVPDTLVSYAMADPVAAGLTLSAAGGAFRSRRKWYRISFQCTAAADYSGITAFQFKLGDPIPEDEWEDHDLNAEDDAE